MAALSAGFVVILAPWLISWWRDPAAIAGLITAYGLFDADRLNLLQGIRDMGSWTSLTVRAEVYWDALNPALLFLDGVMWFPLAVPLVRGLVAYLTSRRGTPDWIVLATFFAAPAAIAVIGQPPVPGRLLLIAPAAAIIATRGCYPGAFKTTVAGSPETLETVATTR
jgi:hypothetical protein